MKHLPSILLVETCILQSKQEIMVIQGVADFNVIVDVFRWHVAFVSLVTSIIFCDSVFLRVVVV